MHIAMPVHSDASECGFSLIELLVSLLITTVLMGMTFATMKDTMSANEAAKLVTGMNSQLRSAVDLFVRDGLQIAQGLPNSRRISVPNGGGAALINRPGPPTAALTFPNDTTIAAVTPGPDLGSTVNTQTTDLITFIGADGTFEGAPVTALQTSPASITIGPAFNISNGDRDDVRVGDLLMVERGAINTLLYVSGVNAQTVSFGTGDPFKLNQFSASATMTGTLNRIAAATGTITATRIRMVTYYVDNAAALGAPTLMRRINMRAATAVGIGIENLRLTYDISDGMKLSTGVRLVTADFAPGGGCGASAACSVNQIAKINLVMAARSWETFATTKRFFRNTVFTQISARNLQFVNEY
jgi:prepilin-type N-terminal cleavage/methylation domain-containing protein